VVDADQALGIEAAALPVAGAVDVDVAGGLVAARARRVALEVGPRADRKDRPRASRVAVGLRVGLAGADVETILGDREVRRRRLEPTGAGDAPQGAETVV